MFLTLACSPKQQESDLERAGVSGLEALRHQIKQTRRWPEAVGPT
jgi:hypothetical protein